jgi:3-methyladenine DNA glycosylase AlkD
MKKLKSMRNPKNIEGMARYGIVYKKAYGITIYELRDLAKNIGRNHELALKLWNTGIREAKLLAVFVEEVDKVTPEQMNKWAEDFECWDDTDQATTSLFDLTPYAWSKVREWSESKKELVKRGAFSLIAGLAAHDKKAKDEDFIKLFPLIKKHSIDERNYVKKAVNWALRGIGKRNKRLNKAAIKLAREIKKIDSKTARWIGSHALKELKSERVQKRLKD